MTSPDGPTEAFIVERRSFDVEGDPIPLFVARPSRPVMATGIMLGAIWSVTRHIEDLCQRLAAAGIAAIAPCLFRGAGIPPLDAPPALLARTFHHADASAQAWARSVAFIDAVACGHSFAQRAGKESS